MTPSKDFIEKLNDSIACQDKGQLTYNDRKNTFFSYKLIIPSVGKIIVNCKVILPNSFTRQVGRMGYFDYKTYTETYTPQLNNRDIIAWVEMKNDKELGYNFALCKGSGQYGEWFILENTNNLSRISNYEREEPFAFEINELESSLKSIYTISYYQTKFFAFTDRKFIEILSFLVGINKNKPCK